MTPPPRTHKKDICSGSEILRYGVFGIGYCGGADFRGATKTRASDTSATGSGGGAFSRAADDVGE